MPSNPSLYRYINFIGGNILDASNVLLLQTELQRLGGNGVGQIYAQGALLNAVFNIAGTSISFVKANPSFNIFALINNQFESLGASVSIGGSQPTVGASNPLYLNWSYDIKTSVDDPTLIDGITGEPTVQAGQLSFNVSWTDTSGTALNPVTQFAKNTSPLILATFDMSVPATVTVTYINGVFPYAWGNANQAGPVRLTDTTGLAPGNTDSRLSDPRTPLDHSVTDVKVKDLISSGFNSTTLPVWLSAHVYTVGFQVVDSNGNVETVVSLSGTGTSGGSAPTWNLSLGGQTIDNVGANQVVWVNGGTAATVKYDPATIAQGGVFTDHIIYTTLKQKLTTFLDTVNTSIQNALIALGNHIGKPLGSAQTHPFPTAFQVGAAPASHVGQALGLGTSHPAQVNSDHAGFTVLRNPANAPAGSDTGYTISDGTSDLTSLRHTGDVWALLSNGANAQGGNGAGGTATNIGTLGLMSKVAAVLAEHVNYKTHGNNNPHNLNAADIGSVDLPTVNALVAGILASANAYTDSKTGVSVRVVTTVGAATSVFVWNGLNPASFLPVSTANDTITYLIMTFGGHFELAVGFGTYSHGRQVALPEASGWASNHWFGIASQGWMSTLVNDQHVAFFKCYVDPATRIITAQAEIDRANRVSNGQASVVAAAYRTI